VRPTLAAALTQALWDAEGKRPEVRSAKAVGGGCIHETLRVELDDGRQVFVKSSSDAPADLFPAEAAGLRALAAPGKIRVPAVLAVGEASGARFLALENVASGSPGPAFSTDFGHRLAALHRATRHDRCGFDHDNYLGSTPQPNGWAEDWCEFWRERRLGHQVELARRRGLADRELVDLCRRLTDRLDDFLGDVPGEQPCLLHGDLWGGNYLVCEAGEPVLIDPAVYYGHREADLAMTRLFGGFDARFYAAYQEAWPLPPGSEQRLAIYELYHLLNHLNLFGASYRSGCISRLRRLV
jgi:protein-ribulosamine 3-kinase